MADYTLGPRNDHVFLCFWYCCIRLCGCVIYSVGFGAGCSDVIFCMHFDNPNKEHWFKERFLLAFKIESELHPKNVLVIRIYLVTHKESQKSGALRNLLFWCNDYRTVQTFCPHGNMSVSYIGFGDSVFSSLEMEYRPHVHNLRISDWITSLFGVRRSGREAGQ